MKHMKKSEAREPLTRTNTFIRDPAREPGLAVRQDFSHLSCNQL